MDPTKLYFKETKFLRDTPIPDQLSGLLLLADPSWDKILAYLYDSTIIEAHSETLLLGCLVLKQLDSTRAEIMNLAVREDQQGQGLGTQLLQTGIDRARKLPVNQLIIRTANSSIGQLYLYQKTGFRITSVDPDFFTRQYPEPILENGLICQDRITLSMSLQ